MIAPQGLRNVGKLIAIIRDEEDARLPGLARQVLQVLATQIEQIEAAVTVLEKQLMAWHKSNPVSQRLATIPGIGPIIATAVAAMVAEPSGFRNGREFAAWLGLVPRQNSTGGKNRLGGLSKRGNQYLRRLLINGASANLLRSKATNADPWVIGLRRRRPCRGGSISEQDGAHRRSPSGGAELCLRAGRRGPAQAAAESLRGVISVRGRGEHKRLGVCANGRCPRRVRGVASRASLTSAQNVLQNLTRLRGRCPVCIAPFSRSPR